MLLTFDISIIFYMEEIKFIELSPYPEFCCRGCCCCLSLFFIFIFFFVCDKFCVYKEEPLTIHGIVRKFHIFLHNNS